VIVIKIVLVDRYFNQRGCVKFVIVRKIINKLWEILRVVKTISVSTKR